MRFFFFLFFLAGLGLPFCVQGFSSCREQGPLLVEVHGPLPLQSMGSRCTGFSSCSMRALEHAGFSSSGTRALERRLSSCGARAQLLRGIWDFPGPGIKPVSPALAGRLPATAPPGKSLIMRFFFPLVFSHCLIKKKKKSIVIFASREPADLCYSGSIKA